MLQTTVVNFKQPSLPIIVNHCPSLPIIAMLQTTVVNFSQLSLPIVVNHCPSLPIIVNHCQSLPCCKQLWKLFHDRHCPSFPTIAFLQATVSLLSIHESFTQARSVRKRTGGFTSQNARPSRCHSWYNYTSKASVHKWSYTRPPYLQGRPGMRVHSNMWTCETSAN